MFSVLSIRLSDCVAVNTLTAKLLDIRTSNLFCLCVCLAANRRTYTHTHKQGPLYDILDC